MCDETSWLREKNCLLFRISTVQLLAVVCGYVFHYYFRHFMLWKEIGLAFCLPG